MKAQIIILVLVGISQFATAQSKDKGDLNCIYNYTYTSAERSQFYPFNIATTIKLVSFRYHKDNYPMQGNNVIVDSLIETIVLTKAQVDSLTDILYNYFFKTRPNYYLITQCYFPRNGILFFDNSGYLREYILLSFYCDRYEGSSEKVNFGDDCVQKMERLRQFFLSAGIRFGTDREIQRYPGEDRD